MKKILLLRYSVVIVFLLIGCNTDLYTKNWASKTLKNRPTVSVLNGYLEYGYTENRGMVFGLLNNNSFSHIQHYLRYTTLLGTIFLILYIWMNRRKSLSLLFPFIMILMGALGNSVDRIKNGFVIDFIHIHLNDILNWPFFFNLADVFISVGLVLLFIQLIFNKIEFIAMKYNNATSKHV